MERIAIIHTGLITAIGNNVQENLSALQQKRHGIRHRPEHTQSTLSLPVGEIKLSNADLVEEVKCRIQIAKLNEPSFLKNGLLPRTALLSILAALEVITPFRKPIYNLNVGLISANTVGGMDTTEQLYPEYEKNPAGFRYNDLSRHESGVITELTMQAIGLDSWCTTLSTACSSSANSLIMAARMLRQNKLDMAIAGGADALSLFTLNGFNSLKILDSDFCRPFDEHRRGLNLGEGAAYLLICRESIAKAHSMKPIAYLSGYANANDAYHQTASSPEGRGNRLAIVKALQKAHLSLKDVSYINLHGTGTENNDLSEGKALQTIANTEESGVPICSSTKAYTGHTLGAAGAVEAVFSCLSLQEQQTWPQLRFQTPINGLKFQPETQSKRLSINHVLSNSFGFGGNCSSLVFSKAT